MSFAGIEQLITKKENKQAKDLISKNNNILTSVNKNGEGPLHIAGFIFYNLFFTFLKLFLIIMNF
mgnify:CR=1 FL=1